MASISIRRHNGRWTFRGQGCCGDTDATRRMYEQAFLEQTLADGGRIVSDAGGQIEVVDRRGRLHRVDLGRDPG